jgi:hypothetical protein
MVAIEAAACLQACEQVGGRLHDLDDGHLPETLEGEACRRVTYEKYHNVADNIPVRLVDDALPIDLVDALYEATIEPAWGTYVSVDQVKDYYKNVRTRVSDMPDDMSVIKEQSTDSNATSAMSVDYTQQEVNQAVSESDIRKDECDDIENHCHSLATRAVAALLQHAATIKSTHTYCHYTRDEVNNIIKSRTIEASNHATTNNSAANSDFHSHEQVWKWAGVVGSCKDNNQTDESSHTNNNIHETDCSINNATINNHDNPTDSINNYLSSLDPNIHGVAVWALRSSVGAQVPYHIDYAEQVRYATNCLVVPVLAATLHCTRQSIVGGDLCLHPGGIHHYEKHGYKACKRAIDVNDTDIVQIAYKYNRLIIQSGDLPHWSTRVTDIEDGAFRVMVGFNVFMRDVGQFVQALPEHSPAFCTWVQDRRLSFSAKHKRISLRQIQEGPPAFRQALVQAKRARERAIFSKRQAALDEAIDVYWKALYDTQSSVGSCSNVESVVTVGELTQALLNNKSVLLLRNAEDTWPTALDVQIHLMRRCKQGKLRIEAASAVESDLTSLQTNEQSIPFHGEDENNIISPLSVVVRVDDK